MSTAMMPQQQAIQQWKSPSQIKQRIEAIQNLMTQVLKKDTDYGIIPGMPKGTKPSLWKPGSEQILAMFQIACEPVVEDLSVEDCYRYRVTTRLTNVQTGEFLGAGIGEASTDETKYKWKACYSKAEFAATDPDRRKIKYTTWEGNEKEQMQVRQEPADLANTILKMAKKRSQIDATLTVTGASSMFEQDLEDLPEETRQEMGRQRTKKAAPAPVGDVVCADCRATNGHLSSCKYHASWKASLQPNAAAQPVAAAPVQPTPTPTTPAPSQATVEPKQGHQRVACKVVGLQVRKAKPLRIYTFNSNEGTWDASCFHESLYPALDKASGQFAIIDISVKNKGGRDYTNVEALIELNGLPYVGSEPADAEKW